MTEAGSSESTRARSWDEQVFEGLKRPGPEDASQAPEAASPTTGDASPESATSDAESPPTGTSPPSGTPSPSAEADSSNEATPEGPVSTRIVIRGRRDSGPVAALPTIDAGPSSEASSEEQSEEQSEPRSQPEPLFQARRGNPGGPVSDRVRITANRSAVRCVICHDDFGDEEPVSCPSCGVTLHEDCARELNACPTLGCTVTREGSRRRGRATGRTGEGGGFLAGLATLFRTFAGVVVAAPLASLAAIVLLAIAGLLGEILAGTGLSPLIYGAVFLAAPALFFVVFMKVLMAFVRSGDDPEP